MADNAQQIETFRHYAEKELKIHTAELETRYQTVIWRQMIYCKRVIKSIRKFLKKNLLIK